MMLADPPCEDKITYPRIILYQGCHQTDDLNCLAQTHLVSKHDTLATVEVLAKPVQTFHLILHEVSTFETRRLHLDFFEWPGPKRLHTFPNLGRRLRREVPPFYKILIRGLESLPAFPIFRLRRNIPNHLLVAKSLKLDEDLAYLVHVG